MASFQKVQSINTVITSDVSSGSKAVLQLKIDGTAEMLSISCPSINVAECIASLIDGYCRLVHGTKTSFWNYSVKDYELLRTDVILGEIIGEGQFGDVHKGTYISKDGQTLAVAVKTCKIESEESMGEKFLEEAYIMQQFDHRHIIRLIGICSDSPIWIVMELAKHGESPALFVTIFAPIVGLGHQHSLVDVVAFSSYPRHARLEKDFMIWLAKIVFDKL
ncbi:focal adhesion kinase 1 [Trichonephila clavipes]|nr:focal adhesion kinase 1 [Trichonephila clavipes]